MYHIQNICGDYSQAIEAFGQEYNSLSRQNRIAVYVRNFRARQYVFAICTVIDAIEKVHENRAKLTPQDPSHCQYKRYTIAFLESAMLAYS